MCVWWIKNVRTLCAERSSVLELQKRVDYVSDVSASPRGIWILSFALLPFVVAFSLGYRKHGCFFVEWSWQRRGTCNYAKFRPSSCFHVKARKRESKSIFMSNRVVNCFLYWTINRQKESFSFSLLLIFSRNGSDGGHWMGLYWMRGSDINKFLWYFVVEEAQGGFVTGSKLEKDKNKNVKIKKVHEGVGTRRVGLGVQGWRNLVFQIVL